MTRRPVIRVVLAAAAAVVCWLPAAPASAASNGQTSFVPTSSGATPRTFFQYVLRPGAALVDTAVLRNLTGHRMAYSLYAADATDVNGAFAIANPNVRPVGVGSWVQLPFRTVVLPAHTSRRVRVRIDVPTNATPGDHAGGVVALAQPTGTVDRGSNVQLKARYGVGVRIYLRVAGPTSPRLTLSHLKLSTSGGLFGSLIGHGSATVHYTVLNTGNLRLLPHGRVVVSTALGATASGRQLGELLPGAGTTSISTAHGLRWGSLLGIVRARVTVTGGPDVAPATAEVTQLTVPWLLIVLIVMAATAVVLARRRRRGRGQHRRGGPPTPDGQPSDRLVGV